uniref:Uncharacterized protein n=1 Tax=Myoviridae sp. ctq9w2 TaxID=2825177 RepID=A0A8S5PWQ6_9CAUD|nr:MAG TPA: hypothetical protein [Myoviridae sp. ctq9w2]
MLHFECFMCVLRYYIYIYNVSGNQYLSAFHAFITNLRVFPYGVRIPLSLLG